MLKQHETPDGILLVPSLRVLLDRFRIEGRGHRVAVEAHAAASKVDHTNVDGDWNESDKFKLLQGSANLGSSIAVSTAAVVEEIVFFYLQLQQVRDKRAQRR